MFSLVADAPLMRPGVSAIEEAGNGALRLTGPTITFRETMLQLLSFTLQSRVVAYTDGVLDAEKLAEFIAQWRGETSVSA